MTPRRVTQMIKNFIWKVAGNDRGAATIEYGLVLGLIAMAIFFILQDLGGMVSTTYDSLGQQVKSSTQQK
jgi:Flp pilus assembly pilin Flp